MLENAARVAPDAVAVTLDDDALTFGEIDERANRIANGLRGLWVGRGDRVLWWGDTSLDAVPVFAALAKIGAVFAPLNARASVEEIAPVAEYARPRLLLCGSSHVEAGRASSRRGSTCPSPRRSRPATRARPEPPISTSAIRTSSSSPAGAPAGRRASCSRTAPTGCAPTSARPPPRAAPAPSACSRSSTWRAGRSRSAPGRAAGPCTSYAPPTPRPCCAPPPAIAPRACIASPRCGPASSSTASTGSTCRSLDEADTGTSATPPELLRAIKDALPHTRTRVFYGSTEAGPGVQLGDADLFRKPGSVGVAQPGVEVRLTDAGEVAMRSPFLMDGYFDDPDATAEALRDGWYHTGDLGALDDEGYLVDRRPRPRRHPHRRRDGRAGRGRGRAAHPSRGRRGRGRRRSRPAVGRGRDRGRRRAGGRGRARPRRAAGLLRGPARRRSSTPAASPSSTPSPAPPPPARSSAPSSSNASSPNTEGTHPANRWQAKWRWEPLTLPTDGRQSGGDRGGGIVFWECRTLFRSRNAWPTQRSRRAARPVRGRGPAADRRRASR